MYDSTGQQILQANEKPFQWKEELHLFGGYQMGEPMFSIYGRDIVDFCGLYNIIDAKTGAMIGALERRGLQSMVRDEWKVYDAMYLHVGAVIEDNLGMALLRRFAVPLAPQNFDLIVGNQRVVDLRQNFNPFTYHLKVDFSTPPHHFDRRLGLAAGILLASIEGRQTEGLSGVFPGARL